MPISIVFICEKEDNNFQIISNTNWTWTRTLLLVAVAVGLLLLTFRMKLISLQLVSSQKEEMVCFPAWTHVCDPALLLVNIPTSYPLIGQCSHFLLPALWLADGHWSDPRPGPRIHPAKGTPQHWGCKNIQNPVCILNTKWYSISDTQSLSGLQLSKSQRSGVTMSLIVWLFWQFRAYY